MRLQDCVSAFQGRGLKNYHNTPADRRQTTDYSSVQNISQKKIYLTRLILDIIPNTVSGIGTKKPPRVPGKFQVIRHTPVLLPQAKSTLYRCFRSRIESETSAASHLPTSHKQPLCQTEKRAARFSSSVTVLEQRSLPGISDNRDTCRRDTYANEQHQVPNHEASLFRQKNF